MFAGRQVGFDISTFWNVWSNPLWEKFWPVPWDWVLDWHNVLDPLLETFQIAVVATLVGCGLALACDIRIASENAQFGSFEIRRGLPNPPDPLIRLIGFGPALHMLLSGDLIDAQEALRIGLVTKVVSAQELIPTVEELAARMGEYPTEGLVATKKAAFAGRDMTAEQSHQYARALSAPLRDSDISREGVTAFAERRKANYGESAS